ncbi:MAG TPA: hydroxyisourate hydrolase [Bryobacteraceae bacterium]|nr:hydroxyisourate hydrolase [Bryobacteraceae bacterium]
MSGISTHVLDTAAGRPAAGIKVLLFLENEQVASGTTDHDGRIKNFGVSVNHGAYRLLFEISGAFYPDISISFIVSDPSAHYHIPLLISPFGYTTYRGS